MRYLCMHFSRNNYNQVEGEKGIIRSQVRKAKKKSKNTCEKKVESLGEIRHARVF
jgi:hypothetical protein